MEVVKPGGTLLTVTEHGFGKRTEIDEYRVQSRGGVGIINIATTRAQRPGRRRRLRAGGRRAAAHHAAGHDPADADQRRPRHRPRDAGRDADRHRRRRQGRVDRAAGRERGRRADSTNRRQDGDIREPIGGGIMQQPRSRVPALGLARWRSRSRRLLRIRAVHRQSVLQRIAPSRQHAARHFATVIFDPRTQGIVTTFTIVNVVAGAAQAADAQGARQGAGRCQADDRRSRAQEGVSDANLDAIQRVLKRERDNGKSPQGRRGSGDVDEIPRGDAAMSKKVSDSRRSLKTETQFVDQSVNAGGRSAIDVDAGRRRGGVEGRDGSAPVKTPDGDDRPEDAGR